MQSLDTSFAKTLIKNYGLIHWSAINANCTSITGSPNNPGVVDSRCTAFTLEQLKQFIKEIELICHHNSPAFDLKLGVRIYFGEYPITAAEMPPDVPTEYMGLHTLLFIPTYFDETTQVYRDFDPSQFQSSLMPAPMDPNKTGAMIAMNHGTETPPPVAAQYNAAGADFMVIADNS